MAKGTATLSEGKGFRKEPFDAVVYDYGIEMIKDKPALCLKFKDEDVGLNVFHGMKVDPKTFEIPGFTDIGHLLISLKNVGVITVISVNDLTGQLEEVEFVQDIRGKHLFFDVKVEESIDKKTGEKYTNYKWSVTKIEEEGVAPAVQQPE